MKEDKEVHILIEDSTNNILGVYRYLDAGLDKLRWFQRIRNECRSHRIDSYKILQRKGKRRLKP